MACQRPEGNNKDALRRSPPVGDAHASPGIANLLVVHHGIVDFGPKTHHLRRKAADRRQHGIGG
jgi:hypothetical protein